MTEPKNPRDALDVIEREAHDWVVRFASGEAMPTDLHEGKLWCERSPAHATAFAKASRLWDGLKPDVFSDVPHSRSRVGARPLTRRVMLGGAIAASAAGAVYVGRHPPLGLWPSWSELAADYRTETGEQRRISLADSVSVDMNTQTGIAVGQAASDAVQIELISGEAVIATMPAAWKAVVVTSGDGRVSATRAKFNLSNDGYSVCVTCLDGDVQVTHQTAAVSLTAGQQVTYDRDGLRAIVASDPAAVTAWQEGRLVFRATPLTDVITQVNRYRRGRIILMNAGLGTKLFSAVFHIRNVDSVVGQIERLFGAKATALPGGIVLLS